MSELKLPKDDRSIEVYRLSGTPVAVEKRSAADFNRVAFAAAHVVADPLADNDPWLTPAIDWDATLRFRHRLWDLGLGVAEAMDTAQRGMGLAWPQAQELISRSLKEAGQIGVVVKLKAGSYQLHPRLTLRGGRVPIEPKPGVRVAGTMKVDQLSLLDAIEDNEDLPDAFRELRKLPDPEKKPPREDKARARARAAARQARPEEDGTS